MKNMIDSTTPGIDIDPDPMSHTAGPWTTSPVNNYDVLSCGSGGGIVARCLDEYADHGKNVCGPAYGSGEIQANQLLIAAAPELLKALILLEDWAHLWTDEDHAYLVQARQAIKKAKGECHGMESITKGS